MEESRNTGQPHTQDSNENIYGASLWQRKLRRRDGKSKTSAIISCSRRPSPTSESQNFRSEKVRLVHPSHTKNMGLSKFRWLAQAQINYTKIRLESILIRNIITKFKNIWLQFLKYNELKIRNIWMLYLPSAS